MIFSILLQHLISKLLSISDLICEVSNFQHNKKLCSKLRSSIINQFENAGPSLENRRVYILACSLYNAKNTVGLYEQDGPDPKQKILWF
jgi:hypothetical protein